MFILKSIDNKKEQSIIKYGKAKDYDKACKIRAYIAAVEADPVLSQEKKEWIQWAKQKADWIDNSLIKTGAVALSGSSKAKK